MKRTTRFAVVIGVVAFLGFTSVSATLDAASPGVSPKKATAVSPQKEKATTVSAKTALTAQSVLQEEELARLLNAAEQTARVQSSATRRIVAESTPVTYFDPFQLTRTSVAVSTPAAAANPTSAASVPATTGTNMVLVASSDAEGAPPGPRVPWVPFPRSPYRPGRR